MPCWWTVLDSCPLWCQGKLFTGAGLSLLQNLSRREQRGAPVCLMCYWPPYPVEACCGAAWGAYTRSRKQNFSPAVSLLRPLLIKFNIMPAGKGKILKDPARVLLQSRQKGWIWNWEALNQYMAWEWYWCCSSSEELRLYQVMIVKEEVVFEKALVKRVGFFLIEDYLLFFLITKTVHVNFIKIRI